MKNISFSKHGLLHRLFLPCFIFFIIVIVTGAGSCKVYSFKDVSIPPEVKTIRIGYIENKARYVNTQLAPQLTDKLKQKINNQTRLTQVQGDDADYDVTAYISGYDVSTSGISGAQAATDRLTVSVHITFKNRLADKKIGTPDFDADVSRNFDFSASLTLNDVEAQLTSTIISNVTDEMFNRIFSNW